MTEADEAVGKALNKAYRFLALRARSEKELRDKLREKGIPEQVIHQVIEKLAELQYLDDGAFAGQWARNLAVNRLYGNRRIEISLREKGILPGAIDRAIEEARLELSEKAAVEKLIQKKIGRRKSTETDIREKHRLYQWLVGRGFPADVIFERLKDL
ncbi:MAG: regulatory protein RecX [Deltaproteobacteria bacterium]|nr:regulatory protein RecX [Deltaproteobacteria bacterium]